MYFNKLFGSIVIIFVLTTVGCASTQFVALRDVPQAPSFVVIPANSYLSEVEFGNKIEQAIISSGVKVIMRPSTKEVTTEQVLEKAENDQAAGMKLTERYFEFEKVSADYIVQTYATSQQVKITKRETQEVLSVLTLTTPYNSPAIEWRRKFLIRALAKMGIPVTNQ